MVNHIGIRGIKHVRTCFECYWKIQINSTSSHHTVSGYFPIPACPQVLYSLLHLCQWNYFFIKHIVLCWKVWFWSHVMFGEVQELYFVGLSQEENFPNSCLLHLMVDFKTCQSQEWTTLFLNLWLFGFIFFIFENS